MQSRCVLTEEEQRWSREYKLCTQTRNLIFQLSTQVESAGRVCVRVCDITQQWTLSPAGRTDKYTAWIQYICTTINHPRDNLWSLTCFPVHSHSAASSDLMNKEEYLNICKFLKHTSNLLHALTKETTETTDTFSFIDRLMLPLLNKSCVCDHFQCSASVGCPWPSIAMWNPGHHAPVLSYAVTPSRHVASTALWAAVERQPS